MADRLRVGLIGCGAFARVLAHYLLEVADITALCSPRESEMEELSAQFSLNVPCSRDVKQMVLQKGLDAVVITAPNFAHAEATIAAAEAGLHVFCEKAMARTVEECWQMVRACERHGRKLMVGHKRRLRPPWARMIELTRPAGPLGAPLAINVCAYADFRPYRHFETWFGDSTLSGGLLHTANCHVIDWFRAMCGDATHVSATWGPQHDRRYRSHDILHATFKFRSGAVATIASALTFPPHAFRESEGPRVVCERGGLKLTPHVDHIDLQWKTLDDPEPHDERFDDLGFDHAYRQELRSFVDWVHEDRPPCLTWIEGLRCVEMIEAAYLSADADGATVRFPLRADLESPPARPAPAARLQTLTP